MTNRIRCWGIIFLMAVVLVVCPAVAGSIQVPDQASTVQSAIRLAQPGDTIYIRGGLYQENLVINKSVNLVGVADTSGGDPPVVLIDPGYPLLTNLPPRLLSYAVIAPQSGNAIYIRAEGVRITDLVLISRGNCIDVGRSSDLSVEGCLLAQCDTGIIGKGGDGLHIAGNRFQTSERTGIDLTFTADTTIENNLFMGGMTGIRADTVQRWSVQHNTFEDLRVVLNGNGVSDSIVQDNTLENCTMGYTFLSSRNNLVQSDQFHNLSQYSLLLNSPAHVVTIGDGNSADLISRDLSSAGVFHTSWLTLSGQNYAFSMVPAGRYEGFRSFGERVRISPELNRTQATDVVKVDAEADLQTWEDIDPFTFGIYRVDQGTPHFTGITYVSGQSIRTTAMLNASADGTYALLARKKVPFGMTMEGITSIFLLIAALVALFLYRRRWQTKKGPSRSRGQEFRKR